MTTGGTSIDDLLTTETQILTLTPGQVVTLGVSGTVRTTLTASSSLTTTRIATMLEQAGSGESNGGSTGTGNGAVGSRGSGSLSLAVGVVWVMVGAVLVL